MALSNGKAEKKTLRHCSYLVPIKVGNHSNKKDRVMKGQTNSALSLIIKGIALDFIYRTVYGTADIASEAYISDK